MLAGHKGHSILYYLAVFVINLARYLAHCFTEEVNERDSIIIIAKQAKAQLGRYHVQHTGKANANSAGFPKDKPDKFAPNNDPRLLCHLLFQATRPIKCIAV